MDEEKEEQLPPEDLNKKYMDLFHDKESRYLNDILTDED